MGEALKQSHPEDIEVTETRVGRKHEVTAIARSAATVLPAGETATPRSR